jgi:hypothetical protein
METFCVVTRFSQTELSAVRTQRFPTGALIVECGEPSFVLFATYKEDEMGKTCSANGKINAFKIFVGNLEISLRRRWEDY